VIDLLRLIKHGAEMVPVTMTGPDADWVPVLLYEAGGQLHTAAIPNITTDTLVNAAAAIKTILQEARAEQAALVVPTYWSEITGEGVARAERVLVTHVTKDHTHCEAALVIRSKTQTPKLGAWDRVADDLEVGAGVFVDAMRAAIA
jgi:hypothetical protein